MKKRMIGILAAALAASALVGVSSASAATEFGSKCAGVNVEPGTLISVRHGASNPLPVAAPTSGVITEWTVSAEVGTVAAPEEELLSHLIRQTLEVWRPAGGKSFTFVGESAGGPTNLHGAATFPARIPVQAGDLLGLGNGINLYCGTGDPEDAIVYGNPKAAPGATAEFPIEEAKFSLPVVAKIEPDVDGDGYGDETQDKCPQSAEYQTACPVVQVVTTPTTTAAAASVPATKISSIPLVGKNAVKLYVSSNVSAPVGVTATIKLGKGKVAKLSAAPQTVAPGSLVPFTLKLNAKVMKALKKLPARKSLKMAIVASATNVGGAPSTSSTTAKLMGLAKPRVK